jgi:3-dehydroquinate synthase
LISLAASAARIIERVIERVPPMSEPLPPSRPGPEHNAENAGDYRQAFSVSFEYPVHFARGAWQAGDGLIESALCRLGAGRRSRCAVFVDAGVAAAHPRLVADVHEYFHAHSARLELASPPTTVPGGESVKNGWGAVRDVMTALGNLHLDRQSFVLAVGGGSMLDMVGFAASIVHRGVRLVRMPTTTLAQNDAGIGVKNGMNEHGMKNFAGTFAPPFAVINDFAFLATLSQRDWIGGVAEAFKVAIIQDRAFFEFLCASAGDFRLRQAGAMEELIRRCAILHLKHIASGGDPFEFGSARPLDFGHWSAHRLEAMSDYSMGHGQAVAVGVALDSFYAMRQGLIGRGDLDRILAAFIECGLPIWHERLSARDAGGELAVLEGLEQFREHLGGTLSVTLPSGIGQKIEVHHIDAGIVEEAAEYLEKRARGEG